MSVYDGYGMTETGTADFEAEAFREATLKAQIRSLRELVHEQAAEIEALQAAVADLLIRAEDLESVQAGDGGALYVLCEEVADHILWIKGLALRLETLEGAVEAVSRLAISLSQKLAADRLKREMDSAIEACRKVAERIEP